MISRKMTQFICQKMNNRRIRNGKKKKLLHKVQEEQQKLSIHVFI